MAKNQESINSSLFELLRSRGLNPTLLDTSGKEIPVPEEAEVFQFKFVIDGEEYGTVTISIDGLHKLIIYFGDDVANSDKESKNKDDTWYKLLNHLKRFSQQHQLSFEVKNTDHLKYDMAKRDHMKKQEKISEGYYPMGKKGSYSDAVPTTKIVIQHNRNIEEGEQRYRNVAKIFVENAEGERFAVPTTKPGIARVYARHIAEGGTPYDEKGKHITSLVEEYSKMAGFVRATRNGQFNESAQQLVNEGINHYQSLRETLSKMTGHRGYSSYFESWTPPLMEDETEENNLNELFVQETLDPRIESVMPILNKLHKKVAEMKEVGDLAEWADKLTEAPGAETLAHDDDTEESNLKAFGLAEDDNLQEPAIDELEEGADHSPVAGAITRRILSQRLDLLKKYGPVAVTQAIDDVADFVGDTEEIGSSDVSGWIKQVEQSLGGVDEGMMDTVKKVGSKVFDKLGGGSEEDLIRDLQKSAGVKVTGKKPEFDVKAKELARSNPSDPAGNFMKGGKDLGIFKEAGLDPAQQADQKINTPAVQRKEKGGDWKVNTKDLAKADEKNMTSSAGMAALKKRMNTIEEDGEFAGDYATGEAGQWRNKGPKAHKPATIGDLVGENVEEGKGPLGQGDLGLALKSLGGSWSSWHEEDSHDPDIEVYEYDDGEGGYYASGSIEHNLKTGEIEVHYQDGENDVDVDGTFNSIGDAMKALRGGNSYPSWGGKKPNFDRLGQRKQHGPDDLRKTDRTGRKGTLAGGPTNQLKQNIQWSKGKHGPKGVLPEGQEDLDTIRRLLGK